METKTFKPNKGKQLQIAAGGETYWRLPIHTPLLTPDDNLYNLLERHLVPHLLPHDLIFISEKVVALLQKRIVRIKDIKTTPLARFLARKVDNKRHTKDFRGFGHGTPMAMQLVIDEIGILRVLAAAGAAAITKPLGIKGLFYIICGKSAKSIDCPMSFILFPYTQYAKLPPHNPNGVAHEIKKKYGHDAVIVDANYLGVCSLGASHKRLTEKFIYEVFKDNPLGQSDELTPFCIVRKAPHSS